MKNNQTGFSAVEGLLIVAVVGIIGAISWTVYSHTHITKQSGSTKQSMTSTPSTKDLVKKAADAFLVSQVGKDKFERYYTFDQSRTSYSNPKDSSYDFIAYHFSPIKAFDESDDIIMVQVNRNDLKQVFADSVPDCINNESLCDFNVDNAKAIAVAKSNGLTDPNVTVGRHNKEDIHATSRGLPFVIVVFGCSQGKSIYIDYRDGSVLGSENSCGSFD